MSQPKIIVWDIETIPNLKKALEYWPELSNFYGKTLKATITSIACIGWKYAGGSKVECINAWDFSRWDKNRNDDYSVCKAFHEIIKDADAIVTQNGRRFDWKHLQTRLIHHGLDPLHKIPHIDTKVLASKNLFMINNKLGTLGREFVKDDKLDNGGWQLWVDTWHKKPEALKLMEKYCKQDVELLDKVFQVLKPFAKNLPNFNHWSSEKVCPNCGSDNVYFNGWHHTQAMSYRRMFCKDCRSHSKLVGKNEHPRNL